MKINNSFSRFLLVGVVNTLIGLSVIFLLLHFEKLNYWLSTFIGNTVGAIVSYYMNKLFTFKDKSPVGKSIWRFFTVIIICYFLSYKMGLSLIHLLSNHVHLLKGGLGNDISVLFGTAMYTILNYIGQRFFTFKMNSKKELISGGQ